MGNKRNLHITLTSPSAVALLEGHAQELVFFVKFLKCVMGRSSVARLMSYDSQPKRMTLLLIVW